jgi:hypothetical protein
LPHCPASPQEFRGAGAVVVEVTATSDLTAVTNSLRVHCLTENITFVKMYPSGHSCCEIDYRQW